MVICNKLIDNIHTFFNTDGDQKENRIHYYNTCDY